MCCLFPTTFILLVSRRFRSNLATLAVYLHADSNSHHIAGAVGGSIGSSLMFTVPTEALAHHCSISRRGLGSHQHTARFVHG